jgi:plasmid stability protein
MARKSKKKKWARRAELKVRLPEPLRLNLEIAARRAGRSMNAEAVWRLSESVLGNRDPYAIAAEAILNGLDQRIVTIIEDMILRANAEKEVRALYRKGAEEDLASSELSDLAVPGDESSDLSPRDMAVRLSAALGRAPTGEELSRAMVLAGGRRLSDDPALWGEALKAGQGAQARSVPNEEPELPMPQRDQAKGGKS